MSWTHRLASFKGATSQIARFSLFVRARCASIARVYGHAFGIRPRRFDRHGLPPVLRRIRIGRDGRGSFLDGRVPRVVVWDLGSLPTSHARPRLAEDCTRMCFDVVASCSLLRVSLVDPQSHPFTSLSRDSRLELHPPTRLRLKRRLHPRRQRRIRGWNRHTVEIVELHPFAYVYVFDDVLRSRRIASTMQTTTLPRRQAMQQHLAATGALLLPAAGPRPALGAAWTDDDGVVLDRTLAYRFTYPAKDASGATIGWTFSRTPRSYFNAAPLSADARQRVVCELVDLKRAMALAVVVGPTPTRMANQDASLSAKRVANAVLTERATARVTTGQRLALASVEEADVVERHGSKYYWYEYVSQGAPTALNPEAETYRRALASTVERDGYVLSLSVSAPDDKWELYQDGFEATRESFQIVPPSQEYVAPDQIPFLRF